MTAVDRGAVRRAPVSALFEERVALSQEGVALVFRGQTLTYRDLNRRANQLARFLQRRGVGPEAVVGVCIPRSFDLIVALLAVIKASGAYLALDVDHPRSRSIWMLRDAGAKVLLTTSDTGWREIPVPCEVLCLDECKHGTANEDDANPTCRTGADGLFKVVYTSGSTGCPKGVLVPMRAVLHRLSAMAARFPFVQGDVALLHRSCMIAGSSWDGFGPLISGVPTLILSKFDPTDAEVWRSVVTRKVSHAAASPSLWNLVLSAAERSTPVWNALRMVIVGGELTDVKMVARWKHVFPQATLVNVYGLTECIYPAACDADRAGGADRYVPAGTPFPNVSMYVLDESGEKASDGASGEIHVSGPCLARGYLNAPTLTAEKFLPDPFSRTPGQRMFRTGDSGGWRADGLLVACGRRDGQIKIRGVRLELAELEAALLACDGVRQAAVVARIDDRGETQLVAYVVPDPGAALCTRALRFAAEQRLQPEAVPARFAVLPQLPTTLHGKVDRSRLPALEPAAATPPDAPRTPTQQVIASIWGNLLHVPDVGLHDNFFTVGGASLTAMQVASRIRQTFDIPLSYDIVLDTDSLESLAAVVDAELAERAEVPPGS